MKALKEKAYAKINLYLDVLCKREDGFHDIKTVMHSVSLCDEVTVAISPARTSTIKLSVEGNVYIPSDGKNLAYKAASLFLEKLGIFANVNIKLVKKIPVAAGLAGGSSDAAAVLRAMNRLYKRPLTLAALCKLGAELGSDVPYCIMGKTAICEGRGELITPISTNIRLHTVIATANEYVSTPAAYSALDRHYSDFDGTVKTGGEEHYAHLIRGLNCGRLAPEGIFNVFEASVLPSCPHATEIKQKMLEFGAVCAMMSGSGPSVFGIFENKSKAQMAAARLLELGYSSYCSESC